MINKNTFKKKFPDVQEHTLSTATVLDRRKIENIVLVFVNAMETGLLNYSYNGEAITLFTSELFQSKLDEMPKGTTLSDPHTGKKCTVISDAPYIMCCEMCISVDFVGHPEAYSCTYFM